MKDVSPVLKTETVTREYWSCMIDDHRHMTMSSAANCIKRKPRAAPIISRNDRMLRMAAMFKEYVSGGTLRSIGDQHNVTPERVRQQIFKLFRMMRRQDQEITLPETLPDVRDNPQYWTGKLEILLKNPDSNYNKALGFWDNISPRAANCLKSEEVETYQDALRLIDSGVKIPNMGSVTKQEIIDAANKCKAASKG